MKTFALLLSLVVSQAAFAADPVTAVPGSDAPANVGPGHGKSDTADKTLLLNKKGTPQSLSNTSKAFADACGGDIKHFCADAKGEKAQMKCLQRHESEIQTPCKEALPSGHLQ